MSIFGFGFLAALFCTLHLATATFSFEDLCKSPLFLLNIICKHIPSPESGSRANTPTVNGSGNGGASGGQNASAASPGATRSLPIVDRLPIGIVPLR